MATNINNLGKNVICFLVVSTVILLFLLVAGEENPGANLTTVYIIKACALFVIYVIFKICKRLYNAGLFPDNFYKE